MGKLAVDQRVGLDELLLDVFEVVEPCLTELRAVAREHAGLGDRPEQRVVPADGEQHEVDRGTGRDLLEGAELAPYLVAARGTSTRYDGSTGYWSFRPMSTVLAPEHARNTTWAGTPGGGSSVSRGV